MTGQENQGVKNGGVIDPEKVFDVFRKCITEAKCRDCEGYYCKGFHKKVDIPTTLALDVLNLLGDGLKRDREAAETETELERRKHMCKVLFNRCVTLCHESLCTFCGMRKTCEQERTFYRKKDET